MEVRFPQQRSIRWTMRSVRTNAGGRGGWQNNVTGTDNDDNNGGIVEERRRRVGGEVVDAAWRSEHLAARRCLPISSHGERIARAVRKNRVVIPAGSTGSGKLTQVPEFLLEDEEEEVVEKDDWIIGGGGNDDPCHPPDGILEQQRQQ